MSAQSPSCADVLACTTPSAVRGLALGAGAAAAVVVVLAVALGDTSTLFAPSTPGGGGLPYGTHDSAATVKPSPTQEKLYGSFADLYAHGRLVDLSAKVGLDVMLPCTASHEKSGHCWRSPLHFSVCAPFAARHY
jgi:hypothetical protein